jgi:hypothetical protein
MASWEVVLEAVTIKHNTGDTQVECEERYAHYVDFGTHSRTRGSWTPNDIHALDWNKAGRIAVVIPKGGIELTQEKVYEHL